LIEEPTWRLAQRLKQRQSPSRGGALLSGLLRCAGCRYVMKTDRMRDRDGTLLRLYRCRGAKAAGKCPAPSTVLARVIDPWVTEQFMGWVGSKSARMTEATDDIAAAQGEVDAARGQLDSYIEADIGGTVGIERYRRELARRHDVLDIAERALGDAVESAGGVGLPSAIELRRIWPDLDLAERRHLLSLGVDAIFLRRSPRQGLSALDSRTLIAWRGEGPDDLPGRGRRVEAIRSIDW
jgi:hypothetical protein